FNAVRFVLLQADGAASQDAAAARSAATAPAATAAATAAAAPAPRPERLADRWILSRLQGAVAAVSDALDALDLGAANRAAYEFVWSEFCDWYLEAAKGPLKDG